MLGEKIPTKNHNFFAEKMLTLHYCRSKRPNGGIKRTEGKKKTPVAIKLASSESSHAIGVQKKFLRSYHEEVSGPQKK